MFCLSGESGRDTYESERDGERERERWGVGGGGGGGTNVAGKGDWGRGGGRKVHVFLTVRSKGCNSAFFRKRTSSPTGLRKRGKGKEKRQLHKNDLTSVCFSFSPCF